jgi:hypothetical protein
MKMLSLAAGLGGMVMLATASPAHAAGCLSGAAVGGVVGHVAGHHALLGAAAGCAVGHHRATVRREEAARANQGGYRAGDDRRMDGRDDDTR